MRRIFCLIALLAGTQFIFGAAVVESVRDLNALKAQAGDHKRLVVLFLGDSEGRNAATSQTMRKAYFENAKFMEWVNQFGILAELDVAASRSADTRISSEMDSLLHAVPPRTIPSIVLLNKNGVIPACI